MTLNITSVIENQIQNFRQATPLPKTSKELDAIQATALSNISLSLPGDCVHHIFSMFPRDRLETAQAPGNVHLPKTGKIVSSIDLGEVSLASRFFYQLIETRRQEIWVTLSKLPLIGSITRSFSSLSDEAIKDRGTERRDTYPAFQRQQGNTDFSEISASEKIRALACFMKSAIDFNAQLNGRAPEAIDYPGDSVMKFQNLEKKLTHQGLFSYACFIKDQKALDTFLGPEPQLCLAEEEWIAKEMIRAATRADVELLQRLKPYASPNARKGRGIMLPLGNQIQYYQKPLIDLIFLISIEKGIGPVFLQCLEWKKEELELKKQQHLANGEQGIPPNIHDELLLASGFNRPAMLAEILNIDEDFYNNYFTSAVYVSGGALLYKETGLQEAFLEGVRANALESITVIFEKKGLPLPALWQGVILARRGNLDEMAVLIENNISQRFPDQALPPLYVTEQQLDPNAALVIGAPSFEEHNYFVEQGWVEQNLDQEEFFDQEIW